MGDLQIPKDRRAAGLFTRLETRYSDFSHRLPSPLQALARQESTYSGSAGKDPFQGIVTFNPVLVATPWLFWNLFKGLDDTLFLGIAEAGMYFVLASVIIDHLIDEQGESPRKLKLFHQALYQRGVSAFRQALASFSPFWSHFDRLAEKHLLGLAAEIEIQGNPEPFDLEKMFTMAHGKVAPIVNTIAALAAASDQMEVLDPIEISLNHISVASQLLDDIGDWQHDLEAGHMTYFLGQCAPPGAWVSGGWPTNEAVKVGIETKWLDTFHMHLVVGWLEDAIEAVRDLQCPGWVDYVNRYRQRADQHLSRFYRAHIGHIFNPNS